jgi:hypothetical protein
MNKQRYTASEIRELWREVVDTAENGDPKYSFELFAGLMKGVLDNNELL